MFCSTPTSNRVGALKAIDIHLPTPEIAAASLQTFVLGCCMPSAVLSRSSTAPDALFALVYKELRRMARRQRRAAGSPLTLDTTALVHEVYLKLHGAPEATLVDRAHMLSLAARAMRQILVDHARGRSRIKRGGPCTITGLREELCVAADMLDLVGLDDALSRLAELDPRAGQLVEWRVFAGLDVAEIARLQGLTERTVFRDWRRARAFLVQQLGLDAT